MLQDISSSRWTLTATTTTTVDNHSSSSSPNSTNINQTDIYGGCNPILFQLGNFSRDGPNVVNSICPDTWLVFSFSMTFMTCYVMVLILCSLGLFYKRNGGHLKSRGIVNIIMTLIADSAFIILICLRFIIGRRVYPCGLYIISYFVLPPAILLPSILRLWRLIFMNRLNALKTCMIHHEKHVSIQKQQPSSFNMNVMNNKNSSSSVPIQNDVVMELKETSPRSTTNHCNHGVNNSSSSNHLSSSNHHSSSNHNNEGTCVKTLENDTTLKSEVTTMWWNNVEFSSSQQQKHKLYTLFVSNRFIICVYFVCFLFHILLYIFFGAIEEGMYQSLQGGGGGMNSSNNNNSGRFMMGSNGGLFIYDRGCVLTNQIIILVACESLFYIIISIILLIICFRIQKDTWFIKRESLILVAIQFSAIILFAICGFVPVFTKITDFFIPYGFVLMSYSFSEVVLCILMPVIYQMKLDSKNGTGAHTTLEPHTSFHGTMTSHSRKNAIRTDLERFLDNRKTFELLLDFAKRSYCPESVLCYKDIERFKSSLKHRKSISLHILKTYLKPNSPLELNVPKISQIHDEIMRSIVDASTLQNTMVPSVSSTMLIPHTATTLSSSSSPTTTTPTNIPPNLFDHIQLHCLHNMTDVFERLKSQSKQARKILQEWKEEEFGSNSGGDGVGITMNSVHGVVSTTITTSHHHHETSIPSSTTLLSSGVIQQDNMNSQTSSPLLSSNNNVAREVCSTDNLSTTTIQSKEFKKKTMWNIFNTLCLMYR
ncbi:hypothetical protein C9374_006186 [Naegleria lovaniensis]|uniref:RGS domain-containing protein n=1 Tax=Naegleria lovaniensis TaxID=51637 RepID=A0AA88GP38_NAELO|nr:uncharacterized protein C9374_006186 [Naegleria lovaniensis]KAG2381802.1 hypothetical protein C9374_006186 [Naegleria lovaniensis]